MIDLILNSHVNGAIQMFSDWKYHLKLLVIMSYSIK